MAGDLDAALTDGMLRGAMKGSSSATYVYCVVKPKSKARKTALPAGGPPGLAGAGKPRVIDAGDGYQLVVASAPLARYDAAAIDARLRDLDWVGGRAAEHEAVVEHAAAIGTVVPMKLFTLFSSDERALEHVRKMRRSLDRVVDRIAGCEEWGLRILRDDARAARASAAAIESAHPARSRRAGKAPSGKDFLLRKKAIDDERLRSGTRGVVEIESLYEGVAEVARRSVRRAAPNRDLAGRVLLDAVFLVPTPAVKKVKSLVAAAAKKIVEQGFDVTLTGPWPAYSFIGGS